jgi:outer membrane protein
MPKKLTGFFCLLLALQGHAQEKWDLRKCVEYALTNNISVKQQDVQARLTALQYHQSRLAQYPSANFTTNGGFSSGRNQNPVTFGLITTGYFFNTYQFQAGADIYNWGSKKNAVLANSFAWQAALANVDKLKDDIALSVAGSFLQTLLAKQQVQVSEIQVNQTKAQLENTRKLVAAGNVPELNAVQIEAQLANDSSNLISAQDNEMQSLLSLKAYLSLDAGTPFDITTPSVNQIPVDDIASLQPEAVYALALKNLPQQRANDLRIKAGEKNILAARGSMYPTVSLFAQLGTSINTTASKITGSTPLNVPVGNVNVNGTSYQVFSNEPVFAYTSSKIPYFGQVSQFFRQSAGVSISVPIANGGTLRTSYERSKLDLQNLELQRDLDNLTLKQNIYKAYTDAVTSLQKFNAASRTVQANEKAFDFAGKRYNIGLLNTIDLIISQNNVYTSRLQMLLAQYDYVFKMKVLEFYKGQGVRL